MCNEAARRTALHLMREDFSQLKIPLRFPHGAPNLGQAPSIRITDTTVIVRAARGEALDPPAENDLSAAARRDDPEPGSDHGIAAEMVTRRWSWLGPAAGRAGKPVYNYRSEGREFRDGATSGRCLIPLDGFYEFTDLGTADGGALTLPLEGQQVPPSPSAGEGKAVQGKAKKAKWLFSLTPDAGDAWNPHDRAAPGLFAVAGLWRGGVDLGKVVTGEAWTMLTCAPGPDIAPYHSRQIVLLPRDRWADWLGVGTRDFVPAAELIAPTPAGTLTVTRVG